MNDVYPENRRLTDRRKGVFFNNSKKVSDIKTNNRCYTCFTKDNLLNCRICKKLLCNECSINNMCTECDDKIWCKCCC